MGYAKPTAARLIDQRARRRATQALLRAHHDEFQMLLMAERARATEEAERLVSARPPTAHQHAASEPPRLMSGRYKPGQNATDRIDVARCRRCHEHHDAGHICQNCGLDERSADALANEYDDDDLRAEIRRDLAEAAWA